MANWINNYEDLEAITLSGETVILPHDEVAEADVFLNGAEIITGKDLLEQRNIELNFQ